MHRISLKFTGSVHSVHHHKHFFEKELLVDLIDIWMGSIDIDSISYQENEVVVTLLSEYRLDEDNDGLTLENMLRFYGEDTLPFRVKGVFMKII